MPPENKNKHRLIPYLFVFAFSLSIATLLYTGFQLVALQRGDVPEEALFKQGGGSAQESAPRQEPISGNDDAPEQVSETDEISADLSTDQPADGNPD